MDYIFSYLSLINAFGFLYLILKNFKSHRNSDEKRAALFINLCLAIWAFGYSFFYIAETKSLAWFWLRIGTLGVSAFPTILAYYYLVTSGAIKKIRRWLRWVWFFGLTAVSMIISQIGDGVGLAKDVVPSGTGWGYTYVSDSSSIKYWFLMLIVLGNIIIGFLFVIRWKKSAALVPIRQKAYIMISVYGLIVAAGVIFDIFLPLFTSYFPPILPVLLFIVFIGNARIFDHYTLAAFSDNSKSQLILNTITDSVLQLDYDGNIISFNLASVNLLGYSKEALSSMNLSALFRDQHIKDRLIQDLLEKKTFAISRRGFWTKTGTRLRL